MARSDGIICKKSKLKNFCDLKTAGGCGVVRFCPIPFFLQSESYVSNFYFKKTKKTGITCNCKVMIFGKNVIAYMLLQVSDCAKKIIILLI